MKVYIFIALFYCIIFPVYGSAMTLPMPTGGYEFLDEDSSEMSRLRDFFIQMEKSHIEEKSPPKWSEHFPDETRGYFLECDIFFPPDRHKSSERSIACHFYQIYIYHNAFVLLLISTGHEISIINWIKEIV